MNQYQLYIFATALDLSNVTPAYWVHSKINFFCIPMPWGQDITQCNKYMFHIISTSLMLAMQGNYPKHNYASLPGRSVHNICNIVIGPHLPNTRALQGGNNVMPITLFHNCSTAHNNVNIVAIRWLRNKLTSNHNQLKSCCTCTGGLEDWLFFI